MPHIPALLNSDGTAPISVWQGVIVRAVHGERLTVAIAELEPDILVPEHRHENEQVGVVVSGSATFTTDDETLELHPGGTYRLGSDVPHEVKAGPKGAVFVECFAPGRTDWQELAPSPHAVTHWPAGD